MHPFAMETAAILMHSFIVDQKMLLCMAVDKLLLCYDIICKHSIYKIELGCVFCIHILKAVQLASWLYMRSAGTIYNSLHSTQPPKLYLLKGSGLPRSRVDHPLNDIWCLGVVQNAQQTLHHRIYTAAQLAQDYTTWGSKYCLLQVQAHVSPYCAVSNHARGSRTQDEFLVHQ